MFDKALIDVSALRWVVDVGLSVRLSLLEETLAHTFVNDDECDLGWVVLTFFALKEAILFLNDLIELFKLKVNDLLAHRVTNTVTVNENVIWHLSLIELAVALEGPHKVV